MNSSTLRTLRRRIDQTCGGATSWRTPLPCSLTIVASYAASYLSACTVLTHFSGYHDLCLYWSSFRFVLEPKNESGAHSNGQENGQVRLPHGKYPSRVGHLYPPLSRPHSIGGFAPSWERCPSYYHDPSLAQFAPTSGCRQALASSERCENSWERSPMIIYAALLIIGSHVIDGLVSCRTTV